MKRVYNNLEELPLALNSDDVAAATGLSRSGAYNLMKSEGFPSIRIGKHIIVQKDAFIRWIDESARRKIEA